MKYFTDKELTHSNTAQRLGIWNWPNEQYIWDNLHALVDNILDPAREKLGDPIFVNCGYRSYSTNVAVGGVSNSQHCKGQAADVRAKDLNKLLNVLKTMDYDQLIYYPNKGFIHVSYVTDRPNRHQFIIDKRR